VHAGLKALASLRMEKGYRDYGHDIDNTDHVLEAGLGFAVDLKKEGGFLGKEAVLAKKAAGPLHRRILQVLLRDPEPMLFHGEVVWRDGKRVGYVRAGSYGFTVGGACGLFLCEAGQPIDGAYLAQGTWEVEVAERRVPATVSLKPLYDPDSSRIKA
jgi:glycine cleavage system aminomethyltransferase T